MDTDAAVIIDDLRKARRAETKRADEAESLVWRAMQMLWTRIPEAAGNESEPLCQWLVEALPIAFRAVQNAERRKQSANEPEAGARVEVQPEPALRPDDAPKTGHPARAVDAALSSLDDLAPCPDCGSELVETSRPDATTLRDYLCIRCGFNLQNIEERPTVGVAGWTKERAEEIRLKHAAAYAEDLVRQADFIIAVLVGRCDAPEGFNVGEVIDEWAEAVWPVFARAAARAREDGK